MISLTVYLLEIARRNGNVLIIGTFCNIVSIASNIFFPFDQCWTEDCKKGHINRRYIIYIHIKDGRKSCFQIFVIVIKCWKWEKEMSKVLILEDVNLLFFLPLLHKVKVMPSLLHPIIKLAFCDTCVVTWWRSFNIY